MAQRLAEICRTFMKRINSLKDDTNHTLAFSPGICVIRVTQQRALLE